MAHIQSSSPGDCRFFGPGFVQLVTIRSFFEVVIVYIWVFVIVKFHKRTIRGQDVSCYIRRVKTLRKSVVMIVKEKWTMK